MNKELKNLLDQITDPTSKAAAQKLYDTIAGTAVEGKKVVQALLAIRRAFVPINEEAGELTESFVATVEAMSRTNFGLNQIRKSNRSLVSLAQKLQDSLIGTNRLSKSELSDLKKKAELERDRQVQGIKFLKNRYNLNDLEGEALKQAVEARTDISEAEKEAFSGYFTDYENIDKFVTAIGLAEADQEQLNNMMGLTGVALDNLSRIGVRAFGGLGINLGALEGRLQEAKAAAIETAEELRLKDPQGNLVSFTNKAKILGAALPSIGKGLTETLVDPLLVGGKLSTTLVENFKKVDKAATDFQRTTGQTLGITNTLNSRFANTVDLLETAGELTKELGLNANNIFSPDTLAAAAEAKNLLGLSGEEAGRLALLSKATGISFDSNLNTLVDTTSQFNKTNKTAVSQGIILKDVSTASEDILVSFQGQTGALAEAASAARRLGLNLAKVNDIADGLLDFESSIENELQAQLLTGRDINLAKAREFALTNDLVGLSNELFANSADINEFSSSTRIAQEAQARALGLSRQELAKIALQRSIQLGLTNKQLEAAAGITAEDLKRATVAEKLEKAVSKIAQLLVGPAELLASMANNADIFYTILGAIAGIKLVGLISQLATAISGFAALGLVGGIAMGTITLGLGAVAIAAGIAAIKNAQEKAMSDIPSIQDGVISPKKGLVVSGPKGSIQLGRDDQVVAGTNLGGGSNMRAVERKLDELISAVKAGGNVYIDGNKAGEAIVLGTFKA